MCASFCDLKDRTMTTLAPFKRIVASLAIATACAIPAHAANTKITMGMAVEPTGLDPTISAPVAIGQVTWQNIYQGLVRLDRDGKVQPQLAESWTVAPDGLTYTFKLRTNAKFQNGEPFNSAVAKFALERAKAADSVNPQKRFYAVITTIETPAPDTLVLKLTEPSGNLLYRLAWPAAVMVEPKSAADNRTAPVGTGPFKLKNWVKGDRVELERDAKFWDTSKKIALEAVTFRFIGDPQAQVAALQSGDVDAMAGIAAPELYSRFQNDKRFATVIGNTELKVVAGMNNTRKPFDDPRVRKALMLAVDRDLLIKAVYAGLGQPIGSHYTPNDPGYIDFTKVYPHDAAKAKALLAEAGHPSGFTFTFKTPQMPYATRSAEVLQAMFAEIGVKMNIVPTEFPAKWVSEVFTGGDFDMTIIAHAEPMDIDIYAREKYYFNYKNPAFTRVNADAERTTDDAARAKLYGEAQKILAEDVPALYLFVLPKLGVWNAKIEGLWKNEPIPSNDLTEVRWVD
jgi:peptide/nickel transport system substrate-binding protein